MYVRMSRDNITKHNDGYVDWIGKFPFYQSSKRRFVRNIEIVSSY